MDIRKCTRCEGIFDMDKADTETVFGRVGHIDNWLPDEHYTICPKCDRANDDFEEISFEEVIEELEDAQAQIHRLKKKLNMSAVDQDMMETYKAVCQENEDLKRKLENRECFIELLTKTINAMSPKGGQA